MRCRLVQHGDVISRDTGLRYIELKPIILIHEYQPLCCEVLNFTITVFPLYNTTHVGLRLVLELLSVASFSAF